MDGWNTIRYDPGEAYFQGLLLLVSGRVMNILTTVKYIICPYDLMKIKKQWFVWLTWIVLTQIRSENK